MAYEVKMPQLGLTMEEGTVGKWAVHEGDTVHKGDTLLEITTDKLTNDVISEFDGVVLKITAHEGDDVPVKGVLAYIGKAGEVLASDQDGTNTGENAKKAAVQPESEKGSAPARGNEKRIFASPLARRRAKELDIDYSALKGSGPGGRIIEKDVLQAQEKETPAARITPLARKLAENLDVDIRGISSGRRILAQDIYAYLERNQKNPSDGEQREESEAMSAMRKAIAKNMLNSHLTSPTVTINMDVDMSAARDFRAQLKENDIKVSYTDILVKFVSKALLEHPLLNCSVSGENIIYKRYVNMGVAVALDDGLVVPNIKNADKKSLTEISAELKELASLAREGKLSMDDMRGGTFTITNLGMYGVDSFTPIINQPEAAILGVTAIKEKVLAINGEPAVRPVMTLSLTVDHRVVDGAVGARFLQRVKKLLEQPAMMLA